MPPVQLSLLDAIQIRRTTLDPRIDRAIRALALPADLDALLRLVAQRDRALGELATQAGKKLRAALKDLQALERRGLVALISPPDIWGLNVVWVAKLGINTGLPPEISP